MPVSRWYSAVLVGSMLVASPDARTQTSADFHRYDAQIDFFSENGPPDSLLLYTGKKIALARQADSLALWGWTQMLVHELYADDSDQALQFLHDIERQRWREPRTADEWEPFVYARANEGWHYFQTGQIWPSVQAYERATALYEQFRYSGFDAVGILYKPLGAHYTRLDDNEKALAVFQKALVLGGDNETLAGLSGNIGIVYWNMGEWHTAEAYYRKGLALTGISDEKRGLLLGRIAEVTLDNGNAAAACRIATQALACLKTISAENRDAISYRARAYRIAGLAYITLHRFAEARHMLEKALRDDESVYGAISREAGKDYTALSRLFRLQGNAPTALDAANRALSAVLPGYRPAHPRDNPNAAQLYEENTIAQAFEAKAEAAELYFNRNGNPDWLALAIDCYDLAWQVEMRLRGVYQYNSSKLNLQKNARKREEAALRMVRMLFERTGNTGWIEKAFGIAERSKATLLLEAVQDNLVRRRLAGNDARFAQADALRRRFSYYEKKLLLESTDPRAPQWRVGADDLRSQLTALERALATDYPNLAGAATLTVTSPPAPGDLPEGTALVTYFWGESHVDILVFQAQSPPVWQRIPNDTALQTLIRQFLAFFENANIMLDNPGGYLNTAFALWQKTMPAEAGSAARLIVIPDGVLNFIPFEALLTADPGSNISLRHAPYTVRRQEIQYAWSYSVLQQQYRLTTTGARYLLAFAPGFAGHERGLAPLLSDESEWETAGHWGARSFTGAQADTRRFFEHASRYRVLHLSTHAFAGEPTRIELYDQALLLPDIYALSLHADLVVLSACQTGLGREQRGEGVMSLARAFAQAGAACVVSGLWSVNDRSTARVLSDFYRLIGEGRSICASLRQAKLEYLNDPEVGAAAQSPYFWAGLAVVGADRSVERNEASLLTAGLLLGGGIVTFIFILWQIFGRRRHFPSKNGPKPAKTK